MVEPRAYWTRGIVHVCLISPESFASIVRSKNCQIISTNFNFPHYSAICRIPATHRPCPYSGPAPTPQRVIINTLLRTDCRYWEQYELPVDESLGETTLIINVDSERINVFFELKNPGGNHTNLISAPTELTWIYLGILVNTYRWEQSGSVWTATFNPTMRGIWSFSFRADRGKCQVKLTAMSTMKLNVGFNSDPTDDELQPLTLNGDLKTTIFYKP